MNTKIWAHRGASGYAPENTLESFELAIEQKADGIELDVQMTKDGELVVIHDETIDRTGNGTGRVQDHTLKELKALNFNKTHPEYASAKIPTLREVYELVKPSGITVNVEMKTGAVDLRQNFFFLTIALFSSPYNDQNGCAPSLRDLHSK